MFNSSKSSLNQIHKLTPPKKGKQELIVQVNIGKKGQSKSIRLCDIHNMSNIEQQIKWFIKNNGLKETAFSYIKEIIVKQINQRKDQIYYQCHSKCTLNCKCSNKIHKFQEKEKDISDLLSATDYSRKSISNKGGMAIIRQPQHLQIKITPKVDNTNSSKNQEISSFVFNSSFTLPSSTGQRQRFFLTDELFENVLESSQNKSSAYFSRMSEFKTKQRQQQNKIMVNNHHFDIKKKASYDVIKPLETSFKKNSTLTLKITTPIRTKPKESLEKKAKVQCITPLPSKKSKNMSTKQRKAALMTPQQPKACETTVPQLIQLNSQNLQHMVMEHKKALKQTQYKSIKNHNLESIFPQKSISLAFQTTLASLFEKLTTNNPPLIKQINSQYVSYQLLAREQLDFMGILFQKIDHRQLNNLNFINFRCNALKHCWKQLQELINTRSII